MEIPTNLLAKVTHNKKRVGIFPEKITKPEPLKLKIFQNACDDGVKMDHKRLEDICPIHGNFTRVDVKLPSGEWVTGTCEKCEDDEHESAMETKEAKQEAEYRVSMLQGIGVPKRFLEKSFDNYICGDSPGKKQAFRVCEKYADGFKEIFEKGLCLTLCGLPGTGKTHLACAIINKLGYKWGHKIKFTGVYRAISEVKATFSGKGETEHEVYDRFVDLDLLVLDEVGVQFGTKTEELIMFEIINRRYEAMKPTIIISNLQAEELKEFIGERVMDRIKEGGGPIIAFDWESFRK